MVVIEKMRIMEKDADVFNTVDIVVEKTEHEIVLKPKNSDNPYDWIVVEFIQGKVQALVYTSFKDENPQIIPYDP